MNINSSQLLKLLGSGVQPAASPFQPTSASGVASQAFADLLRKAQDGGLASELPVTLGPDAEGMALDEGQLARLSIAADQLETAGVHTALVNIDGQKLLLDVHARQIVGRAATAENGITGGIDGVLDLGDARAVAQDGAQQSLASAWSAPGNRLRTGTIGPPAATLAGNSDVLKILSQLAGNGTAG